MNSLYEAKEIAKRILTARKLLSRKELANRIGVSERTVHAWETEENKPKYPSLVAIARVTGCSESWLLTGEGEPFPEYKDEITGESEISPALQDMIDGVLYMMTPAEIEKMKEFDFGMRKLGVVESPEKLLVEALKVFRYANRSNQSGGE